MSIADCQVCGVPHYVGGCPKLAIVTKECSATVASEGIFRAATKIVCTDCDGSGIGGHGGTCPVCHGTGDQPL
jgi:hypothetical protein